MIYPVKFGFEGLEGIGETIQAKLQGLVRQGEVTISVVAGGKRGRAQNTLIANTQAKPRSRRWKRDPFYLSPGARERIRFLMRGLMSVEETTRSNAAEGIGAEMLGSIAENVAAQRNPQGDGFTPLTKRYQAVKRRKHGFIRPILRATGDLLDGLTVKIERTR